MKNDDVIDELLALDRVILAREHPRLENALVRAASAGRASGCEHGGLAPPGLPPSDGQPVGDRQARVTRW